MFKRVLPVVIVAGFLAGCMDNQSSRVAIKPVEKRNPAPDFTLKDADGKMLKLSDHKGKVVLLNFWATGAGRAVLKFRGLLNLNRNIVIRDWW